MEREGLKMRIVASTRASSNPHLALRSNDEREIQSGEQDAREKSYSNRGSSPSSSSASSFDTDSDESEVATDSDTTSSPRVSCIREAQLSSDGSCIFTTDHDRNFSVYSSNPNDGRLTPYASFTASSPIRAFAPYPFFDINDSETTTVLISIKDSYITLHNALWDLSRTYTTGQDETQPPPSTPVDVSTKLASYKLINHVTEEVIAPISLAYNTSGTHFLAGSLNQISIFDMNYTDVPIHKITSSQRKRAGGLGAGFKGFVSSLDISSDGILAAGTWARHISIFDKEGLGDEITHFSLQSMINRRPGMDGDGVSQVKWSPCSTYLYIAERSSDVILIYDSRKFGLALGHCAGRRAMTKQKLGFDIWSSGDMDPYGGHDASHEIWAGGTDGEIRVWKEPHLKEGALEADEVLEVSDAPIVSALVFPNGSAVATASGTLGLDEQVTQSKNWGFLDILRFGAEA